jgi:hypothetical protein
MGFTYNGDDGRVYPDIVVQGAVLVAESGKTYDLDVDPGDGRWSVSGGQQSPPDAPSEPSSVDSAPPSTESEN